jgi:hypothetical protein
MYSQYLEWKQDKTLSVWESIQKMLCMKKLRKFFEVDNQNFWAKNPKISKQKLRVRFLWSRFARFFCFIQRILRFFQAKQTLWQRPASQFLVNNALAKEIKKLHLY